MELKLIDVELKQSNLMKELMLTDICREISPLGLFIKHMECQSLSILRYVVNHATTILVCLYQAIILLIKSIRGLSGNHFVGQSLVFENSDFSANRLSSYRPRLNASSTNLNEI